MTPVSDDLLQVHERLILNTLPYAMLIEQQFGEFLQPSPVGIYKIGECDPSIIPNKAYYSEKVMADGNRIVSPITDFQTETEAVVDSAGQLVIPPYMMRSKEKYLSAQPTVPARGIYLIELLINRYIEQTVQHSKYNHYSRKIDAQILPEHLYLHSSGQLERACDSIFGQIGDFMRQDDWHIYFVKRQQLDITVEKTIDYRIYDYHKRLETPTNGGE